MKELYIYQVNVCDVHGNNVYDVMQVHATDDTHARQLAEADASELYPLNQMGAQNAVQIRPLICRHCGSVEILVDGKEACRNWCS